MKKILGLDIGVTSIGWGLIDEEGNILDTGVRLFEESDAKNNLDRRTFRGQRRLIRRRSQRIKDMYELLLKAGIIDHNFTHLSNPYELRIKGLSEKLSNHELATVLLHYAKRRGSSLEVVEDESVKSEESTKAILMNNEKELKNKKYVVNVQLDRFTNKGKIRGTINNFKTKDYEREITDFLNIQELNKDFQTKIINLIKRRRHFSEGPGSLNSPSPYGRYRIVIGNIEKEIKELISKKYEKQYLKSNFTLKYLDKEYQVFKNGRIINKEKYDLIALMRGRCSIYPDQFRSPKMAFSAELFNLLNELNNLKIINREDNKLTKDEKNNVINYVRKKGSITINQLLKILDCKLENIKGFRIDKNEKPIITEFKGYKKLLKVYNDLDIKIDDDETLDKIIEVLTQTIVEEERLTELRKLNINAKLYSSISTLPGIKEYHSLSLKAIYLLNKEMLYNSLNQQEIISSFKLNEENKTQKLLLDDSLILSPVAKRAHREALKLVDTLMKENGTFERIIVETTRAKNTADEIKQIKEIQKNNEKNIKEAQDIIGDYAKELVNRSNVLKLRLYKEQNGKCAYTNETLDIARLLSDSNAYEIDHIIPFSVSYDDSYNNKVLVTHSVNQKKGNKTPFGYFSKGDLANNSKVNSWSVFREFVTSNGNYSIKKKQNLLFEEDITKHNVQADFINRNLVDTSYAVRSLMTTLKNYFKTNNIDTKVLTIKGKQTSYFRKTGLVLYGRKYPNRINPFKKDRNKYIHHAVDALIIAGLSGQEHIKKLYNLSEHIDLSTGEVTEYVNADFESKMSQYLLKIGEINDKDINYSWKIDSKPNRSISDQTVYSTRSIEGTDYVVKKYNNIYEIDSEKLKGIFEDNKRDKLLIYRNDPKSFEKLYNIYLQYSHEKKPYAAYKAINGNITKYSKSNNGPIITSLKYIEDKLGNHLDITPNDSNNRKVVKLQISPYRTDMYFSNAYKQYKFITVRYKNVVPNGSIREISKTWYEEEKNRKNIDDTYVFMFSLYRNSIIKIDKEEKNNIETNIYRFIGTNNDNTNVIEVKPIEQYEKKQLMITIGKKITQITKYNISITGRISKVVNEKLKLKF